MGSSGAAARPILATLAAVVAFVLNQAAAAGPGVLQGSIDRAMEARQGCVVVLGVGSDRLLASHRIDLAARRLVRPGSAIKPFTLLALLEAGAVRADTRWQCSRELRIAGRRMDCTHASMATPLDAAAALAYSCNNYFAHFAVELPYDALVHAFERAGLASRTGLARDEATGVIRPASDRQQQRLQALGEAQIEVTPLGLAEAYRKLVRRRGVPGVEQRGLTPIFAGLEASVAFGMGRQASVAGIAVAGKTGTAAAAEGSWTHAWFAGYAPADHPEIVLVVFLERGRGGSDAATVARDIFASWAAARQGS